MKVFKKIRFNEGFHRIEQRSGFKRIVARSWTPTHFWAKVDFLIARSSPMCVCF
jgi:hypothetical protein